MNKQEIKRRIVFHINKAMELLEKLEDAKEETNTSLVDIARSTIGVDASPDDLVDDDVGCAESVSNIIRQKFPDFPIIPGTWTLWDRLENDSRFTRVDNPKPGDIIISPTGTVRNAPFVGHVGIMLDEERIMSSTSATGLWEQNYSIDSWVSRWAAAGYPIYLYRLNA